MSVWKREGRGRGGKEEGKTIFVKSEIGIWGFSKSGFLRPKMLETREIGKNENLAHRKTGFS